MTLRPCAPSDRGGQIVLGRRELSLALLRVAGCALLSTRWTSLASAAVAQGETASDESDEDGDRLVPPKLASRIKAISNVFEVGSPEPDYAYVENLDDGRGYTVTSYGFCTGTGEVAAVIECYAKVIPGTALTNFIALMPPRADATGDLTGFAALWRHEASVSARLVDACEAEANELFFVPAMAAAQTSNVCTPIGRAVFYDTWLQHGAGADPDSLRAIYSDTVLQTGAPPQCSEPDFLRAFLEVRRSVLLNPANAETRRVWRESISRVDALLNLVDHNPLLNPPIKVSSAESDVVIS